MGISFDTLADLLAHGFDTVIDVRSPAEFAEDHVPGAINLPALSNEERAQVGTIYVQDDPFRARKIGAALVAQNVAHHLQGPLADKAGGWTPLVYCWRGGQRSGSFASILSQIGWRAGVIEGGYQSFRRHVHAFLYDEPLNLNVILLDGNTGTAKTDILHRLASLGVQIIDLEGLANHRGSLLGANEAPQPAQKAFETALACALSALDRNRPVLIEAESNKIGARIVPPTVWAAMKAAPRIEITATLDARASYLAQAYANLETQSFTDKLEVLRRHRGSHVDTWLDLLQAGDSHGLARALMHDHYDPSYRAARAKHAPTISKHLTAGALDEPDRQAMAVQIAEWLAAL